MMRFSPVQAGGVYRLVFAIESGTPRVQKLIKKNLDLERPAQYRLASKRGFSMGGFFMMGFLDEPRRDLEYHQFRAPVQAANPPHSLSSRRSPTPKSGGSSEAGAESVRRL